MMRLIKQKFINSWLLSRLKQQSSLLKHEVFKLGGYFIVNIQSQRILATGMDCCIHLAFAKAMSEWVERISFINNRADLAVGCLTDRSEGFAALPRVMKKAQERVKQNSLFEATERYCWPRWFHDQQLHYEQFNSSSLQLVLSHMIQGYDLTFVQPSISSSLQVVFAYCFKGKALFAGGACDYSRDQAQSKAFTELLRHIVLASKQHVPESAYSNRLHWLKEQGAPLLLKRLLVQGKKRIELPELEIDQFVSSINSDYLVYRKRFLGQLEFIDANPRLPYI